MAKKTQMNGMKNGSNQKQRTMLLNGGETQMKNGKKNGKMFLMIKK